MKKYALLLQGCFLVGSEKDLVNSQKEKSKDSHIHFVDDTQQNAIRLWIESLEHPVDIANIIHRVRVLEGHLKKRDAAKTKEKN